MATKYHVFTTGEQPIESRAKKDAAIKIGEATGLSFRVVTDSGTVVHNHAVEDAGLEPQDFRLVLADGNGTQEFGSLPVAVKAGEAQALPFQVWHKGEIVHDAMSDVGNEISQAEVAEGSEEYWKDRWETEEAEDAEARQKAAEPKSGPTVAIHAHTHRDFPGNYSIAMIPFTKVLAEAYGGVEVTEEKFPGKLTRRAHLGGSAKAVKGFGKLLDEQVEEVFAELKVWQKKHADRRRALTDMQRYLEHREFIAEFARKAARKIKKGDLS